MMTDSSYPPISDDPSTLKDCSPPEKQRQPRSETLFLLNPDGMGHYHRDQAAPAYLNWYPPIGE